MSISRQFNSGEEDGELAGELDLDPVAVGGSAKEASETTTGRDGGGVPPRRSGGGSSTAPSSARSGNRRTGPRQFLHEVNVEMRKVAWPTRETTINYSIVVLITLAVLMAIIFGLDLGFSKLALFLFK